MKIELRGVSKAYGRMRALDRVGLELGAGDVLGVVGANGSGKTTLLRCLAGVSAPDQGMILYDEEEFQRGRQDLRRRLIFLPDFPFLFSEMSVIRHVGMVVRVYERERPGLEDQVVELLREFDLLQLAERPLGSLSRGQAYKAALVAALAVDPELWLFDEPFASGMDPHGLQAFRRQVQSGVERGRIVVFSTQILEVVERMATRVCVLHQGEVRAFEPVQTFRRAEEGAEGPLQEIFQALRAEPS